MLPLKSYFLVYYCVFIFNWVYHLILHTSKLVFNLIFFLSDLICFQQWVQDSAKLIQTDSVTYVWNWLLLKKSAVLQTILRKCTRRTRISHGLLMCVALHVWRHWVLGMQKKCSHEVWCPNDLAWAERSLQWLLFLSAWIYRPYYSKEKETHCLPKFAISNAPSRALRKFTCAHTFRSRNAEFHQFWGTFQWWICGEQWSRKRE